MKILHFVGLCLFMNGQWDNELVVSQTKEVQPEDLEIPLPIPIEEMKKGIIAKVPRFPNEGMNEIEGWIVCDDIEEGEKVLESFKGQFGSVHNEPQNDPFLDFMKGLLDTLKGLRSEIEQKIEQNKLEGQEQPEEHKEHGHESEG